MKTTFSEMTAGINPINDEFEAMLCEIKMQAAGQCAPDIGSTAASAIEADVDVANRNAAFCDNDVTDLDFDDDFDESYLDCDDGDDGVFGDPDEDDSGEDDSDEDDWDEDDSDEDDSYTHNEDLTKEEDLEIFIKDCEKARDKEDGWGNYV